MDSLIDMQHIHKIYTTGHAVHALRDVSLSVRPGEFLAIVGPSGSGKSTLLHIMGCLDTPTHGRYTLCGRAVEGLGAPALARLRQQVLGFVFQSFNLLPRYSAWENVALPLLYQGVAPARRKQLALQALEQVGLGQRAGHRSTQLSGGQQQRVAIARALVTRPQVLLADEPTGNLDSAAGDTVMALLQAHHAAGGTLVLITHDPRVAAQAQRRIRIADGRLQAAES